MPNAVLHIVIGALVVAWWMPAQAQTPQPMPRATNVRVDPAVAAPLAPIVNRIHLADNASRAYIADVNGRGRPITVYNGMMLVLNGKGFNTQRPASDPPATCRCSRGRVRPVFRSKSGIGATRESRSRFRKARR